ncbi:MAG: enoyl-CoA hydratase/isomerase family protein, partial [Alphaproteobacteria bacterium]|nr:enoyl-CoA hydratase/isomerase family protein [Alphaproteobacteria bacterium]
MSQTLVKTETHQRVRLIRLNRLDKLNALCAELITQLGDALDAAEGDDEIGCVVLTGNQKAFAAGADITEMVN